MIWRRNSGKIYAPRPLFQERASRFLSPMVLREFRQVWRRCKWVQNEGGDDTTTKIMIHLPMRLLRINEGRYDSAIVVQLPRNRCRPAIIQRKSSGLVPNVLLRFSLSLDHPAIVVILRLSSDSSSYYDGSRRAIALGLCGCLCGWGCDWQWHNERRLRMNS